MKKLTRLQLIILCLVLLLGFILRSQNHIYFPKRGETSDEYAFAFQGLSLLTKGYPIAWSAIQAYPKENRSDLTLQGIYFPIVHPYLDHPPLYGLLSASTAMLKDQVTFEAVQLSTIRKLPLVLGMITSLLLFILSSKLFGRRVGFISLTIFSTATLYVLNSRLSVAEVLITPLLLFLILVLTNVKKNISDKTIFILSTISILAIFTKVLGVIAFLTAAYFLLFEVRVSKKPFITFICLFLLGFVALIIYGYSYGGELFFQIQSYQGGRILGAQTFFTLITTPIIVNSIYYDAWYFIGIFGLVYLSTNYKKNKLIIIPTILYIILMLFSVTKTDLHAWYLIPLFPFMAISSAIVFDDLLRKLNWGAFFWVLILGIYLIESVFSNFLVMNTNTFRILLILIVAPIFIVLTLKKETVYKTLLYIYLFLFIVGNAYTTLNYS